MPRLSGVARRRLLVLALLGASAWLAVLVTRQLAREAYADEVFEVDPARIGLIGLPDDLPQAWRQDLERAVERLRATGRLNVFEDASLARVGRILGEVPWIEAVDAVGRRFPDGLDASIRVRRPVARIADDGNDVTRWAWVDRDGVLLPPPGPPGHPDWKSVPLVLTEKLPARLPEFGQRVRDVGVLAGAATAHRLAQVLDTQEELQLLVVDASEHARIGGVETSRLGTARSEVELLFRRTKAANEMPLMVSWGSPEPYLSYLPPEGRPTFEHRWNLLVRAGRDYPRYANLARLVVRYGQAIAQEGGTARAPHGR